MSRTIGGTRGQVVVEVDLVNYVDSLLAEDGKIPAEQVRRMRATGMVDPAQSYLILPKAVANQLGVPVTGTAVVRRPNRRKRTRPVVDDVQVELCGRDGVFRAIVEPRGKAVRIGRILLTALDLIVDTDTQTLQPRDPKGIITEIE